VSEELFSPSWYRVAPLRPRLRSHIRIHQHQYRGETWYILQDTVTGRHHRFTPVAHDVISMMDGQHNIQSIWDATMTQLGDEAPTQGEMIQLLAQLHAVDALQCDITPDTEELFRRYQQSEQRKWKQRLMTPLAIRLPLLDPDKFLTRYLNWVRPLFSWKAAVVWLMVVGLAALLAGQHWHALRYEITQQVLSPWNLLVLWLVYPLVKGLHELGHAFATRVWGGEVHEMGVLFLVFIPIPYVDASAASAFADKRKRIIVGAAGIIVELFLAAIAFFVWLNVEPGLIRTIAFNIMLIGGVSSLLFNGNPLLRFDGYYILADALEIPNLGTRANRYLGYLVERYAFKLEDARYPTTSVKERAWLVGYSIAAYLYRIVILFAIALYVAGAFFVVGVLLAVWAVTTQLLLPLMKLAKYVLTGDRLRPVRARAVTSSAGLFGLLMILLFVMPMPLATHTQGVVWLPEQARIRTGTNCFVKAILAPRDSVVEKGQPLVACDDPGLPAKVKELQAKLQEYQARLDAEKVKDLVRAEILQEDLSTTKAELVRAQERLEQLEIRSKVDGTFVVPRYDDLVGRYLPQGEVLAYVIDPKLVRVRAVVDQADIGLVRKQTESIDLRLVTQVGNIIQAKIHQEIPAATDQLPSAALSTQFGGPFPVEPDDEKYLRTLQKVFQFELLPASNLPVNVIGTRVEVRFAHGNEPLGFRVYRLIRQLLLRKFNA
jgi:putative peptide zinc metalloprotease protein